jgi:type VI secretion system protein ImpK
MSESRHTPSPFGEVERTLIIPKPHARLSGSTERPGAVQTTTLESPAPTSGLNRLLAAANPLLNVVPQLRATLHQPDPVGLRDSLARDLKKFEADARAAGVAPETVTGASYALCTLLDEAVASTPWGSGMWGTNSLLLAFHKENWGGEKFFLILSKIAQSPRENRDLLELFYVCLALGLEGLYGARDNGRTQLATLRERLADILRKQRGEYERTLSPQWRPAPVQRHRFLAAVPLWAGFAACGVILLGFFLAFSYHLNTFSDPLFTRIHTLRVASDPAPKRSVQASAPRLEGLLEPEIKRKLVTVSDNVDRSTITIIGDGLFAAGSSSISSGYEPLLTRIAEALEQVNGQVRVIGHTDSQPIRSVRFPSNWHLSRERARSVAQMIARGVSAPDRLTFEGLADTQPVELNDTPANRARNRRVEIVLLVAPSAESSAQLSGPAAPGKR